MSFNEACMYGGSWFVLSNALAATHLKFPNKDVLLRSLDMLVPSMIVIDSLHLLLCTYCRAILN